VITNYGGGLAPSIIEPSHEVQTSLPNLQQYILYAMAGTNAAPLPQSTLGIEYNGGSSYDGMFATWNWGSVTSPMNNCGRFFGIDGNWWKANVNDPRAVILKGESDTNNLGFGAFILEVHTATGSPGNHGIFANPLYVATNGFTAIGNLTDAADNNQNSLKPPFWLTVYGDGSAWSGSSSTAPSFGIMSKALVSTPVAAGEENDGTSRYWTDNGGVRHRYQLDNGFSGSTNAAPGNTTTPKLWVNYTNSGAVYKIPLYQ
jgi:hypothetical protein